MVDRISSKPSISPETPSAYAPLTEDALRLVREEGLTGYLAYRKLQPSQLEDKALRRSAADALLKANGIKMPSITATDEAELAIMRAYETGTIATFKFQPSDPGLIEGRDGALEKDRNWFHDREYIEKNSLRGWDAKTADRLIRSQNQASYSVRDSWAVSPTINEQSGVKSGPSTYAAFKGGDTYGYNAYGGATYFNGYPERKSPLGPHNYENGVAGRLLTGSFVSGPHRSAGSYLRYGEAAWRNFLKAYTYLDDIPHGLLLSRLDVNLIKRVNELATTPEPGASASVFRAFGNFFRGEAAKPGELRNGKQVSRFETFTEKQVEILEKQGITVHSIPLPDGTVEGWLEYPAPQDVAVKLEEMVVTLRTSLSAEEPDVERAVATFQKAFVALHPFGDGNGRTSRLIANRVLDEFDLPPIIFENQDRDLVASDDEWHVEVLRGIERSRRIVNENSWEGSAENAWDHYMRQTQSIDHNVGDSVPQYASVNKRVSVEGLPFDLGADGFLYSPTGRPHLVLDGALIPVGQLDYYLLARRLKAMPQEVREAKLTELTTDTLKLYGRLQGGLGDDGVKVASEYAAVDADLHFASKPHPRLAAQMVELMDPTLARADQLFVTYGQGRPTSELMSQYSQRDLEYKMLQDALAAQGFNGLSDQLMVHRRKLFSLAKERFTKLIEPVGSFQGPRNFTYHYERIMFENSPLRHASLEAAIAADGDDEMVVYRGAFAIEGLVGMAPNNDPRKPTAREIAEVRAENGAVPNLLRALRAITGSAEGAEMICITTDLSLLQRTAFANATRVHAILMSGLLAPAVKAIAADTHIGHIGKIDAPIIDIERPKNKPGVELEAAMSKAVFVLKVPKKDLLPAHGTALNNGTFIHEQEVEGLTRLGYGNVLSAFPYTRLGEIDKPLPPEPKRATHKTSTPGAAGGHAPSDPKPIGDVLLPPLPSRGKP